MTEENKLPEGPSQQPTYILTQAYYPPDEQDDQINLADYIRVLWRRKFLILAGTLTGYCLLPRSDFLLH